MKCYKNTPAVNKGRRYILRHFSKIKSQKESHNSRNQGFSYYFCMMREGAGSGSESESGSIPLTNGFESGYGRPKNMWIRWIRIRFRIRIRNTGTSLLFTSCYIKCFKNTGTPTVNKGERLRIIGACLPSYLCYKMGSSTQPICEYCPRTKADV